MSDGGTMTRTEEGRPEDAGTDRLAERVDETAPDLRSWEKPAYARWFRWAAGGGLILGAVGGILTGGLTAPAVTLAVCLIVMLFALREPNRELPDATDRVVEWSRRLEAGEPIDLVDARGRPMSRAEALAELEQARDLCEVHFGNGVILQICGVFALSLGMLGFTLVRLRAAGLSVTMFVVAATVLGLLVLPAVWIGARRNRRIRATLDAQIEAFLAEDDGTDRDASSGANLGELQA